MLLLDLHQNRPAPLIYDISGALRVPVTRVGDFYKKRGGPGCGKSGAWNGGGYYGEQCHVHFHSHSQAALNAFVAQTSIKVISADNETTAPTLAPGVHVVLLDEPFLTSLPLCRRLIKLDGRANVKLVPIFLDAALTKPASEVPLLQWWSSRLNSGDDSRTPDQRVEIDTVLTRLGSIVARLRDVLSPAVPA
jgi:hypothetical protein